MALVFRLRQLPCWITRVLFKSQEFCRSSRYSKDSMHIYHLIVLYRLSNLSLIRFAALAALLIVAVSIFTLTKTRISILSKVCAVFKLNIQAARITDFNIINVLFSHYCLRSHSWTRVNNVCYAFLVLTTNRRKLSWKWTRDVGRLVSVEQAPVFTWKSFKVLIACMLCIYCIMKCLLLAIAPSLSSNNQWVRCWLDW